MARNPWSLEGKVVLLTGAAGNIGQATARILSDRGATITATDLPGKELKALGKELGGSHRVVPADLTDLGDLRSLVEGTVDAFGKLDVLVNNAGNLDSGGPLLECDEDRYEAIMAVNVKAPFFLMQYAIPGMLERGGGTIVNVASAMSMIGLPGYSAYTVSKGAILQLTKQVSVDFAARGIRCNAVCPGTMLTEEGRRGLEQKGAEEYREFLEGLHTAGRVGKVEEAAELIAFLASDAASFVHGAAATVDGGITAW